MRLISYRHAGAERWGMVSGDQVNDLSASVAPTIRHALELFYLPEIRRRAAQVSSLLPLNAIEFLPAIPFSEKVICVGLNYRQHAQETGKELPQHPMLFTRFAASQTGHGTALVRPRVSEKFDFEGELAVVIGRRCRHVRREQAMSVVAGYACFNDGSVRDWQFHTAQYTPGKNFARSGALGPWLVTADEIPDPAALTLTTRLNGEQVQHSPVSDMIFPVPELIEYISTFTELVPGDVIATGTPSGVGAARTPRLWMKAGDIVEVEISGIGVLRNSVIDEA